MLQIPKSTSLMTSVYEEDPINEPIKTNKEADIAIGGLHVLELLAVGCWIT